ncbi:TRAP transporter small permease [Azospirillum doebereinerae]|uniref:TRAP transporter small permease protein n=1 Tax=Azospirillum doebereinerae TaxID=92933 RepID=A0A3S0XN18_9PROT|nr:TRAP transporter small permease [Azospirillum doebereinerae]MCG5241533.1 TRAP transporter small permease [Azospirillum doebereinerae]RUQ71456.1 TRAP transporter small permease [Azospirillum doebereinerae]
MIQDCLVEDGVRAQPRRLLTRLNIGLARVSTVIAVVGLLCIVGIVFYEVVGRYVFNRTPTWAESLALVLVLYVTMLGAAVAVRDAGHIGMDSILVLLPAHVQHWFEILIHLLVAGFGVAMACNGWILGMSVANFLIPNLGLPEILRYIPLALSGAMIVLFSVEHTLALLRHEEVEPTWN